MEFVDLRLEWMDLVVFWQTKNDVARGGRMQLYIGSRELRNWGFPFRIVLREPETPKGARRLQSETNGAMRFGCSIL